MDASQIESLLWQSESETLDFKVRSYPFDGATPEERGELIKDILAFANAWRQTDAHILIGVEEVKRGHSIVRGVDQHIENRTLTVETNVFYGHFFDSFDRSSSSIDPLVIQLAVLQRMRDRREI